MPPTEYAAEVMLRLTPEDFGVLQSIQLPGEPRAHAYLRVAREAVLPPSLLLRYRKPPLFPTWLTMGPLSPLQADARGKALLERGFAVELAEVEGRSPAPMWPEDVPEPEPHIPLGVTWADPPQG